MDVSIAAPVNNAPIVMNALGNDQIRMAAISVVNTITGIIISKTLHKR